MKIIGITDIHGNISMLDKISDNLKLADVIILTGDITHFGRDKEAKKVIDKFRSINPNILAVPGNCDYREVEEYLDRENINLHKKFISIGGYDFVGIGGSLPCPGKTPNEFEEKDYQEISDDLLVEISKHQNIILVTHQPPYNTINDYIGWDKHVGSNVLREFIEINQPLVCFCGHIHEGVGIDQIGKTKIVNPGPIKLGGYTFAIIENNEVTLEIRNFQ